MPAEGTSIRIPVTEPSQVGEARRAASALAEAAGLDETATGRVALIATEAATNLVEHAQGTGEILLRRLRAPGPPGVEVLAVDRGPGIADVARALEDGDPTTRTSGTGLGAIARAASAFELHSTPGVGTCAWAQVWAGTAPARLEVGATCVPVTGEVECGDGWALEETPSRASLLVADGVGHGAAAATAAREAKDAFVRSAGRSPTERLEAIHAALGSTRGAAASILVLDFAAREATFCGVGNVSGAILGEEHRAMVSLPGALGLDARRVQEFRYPWPRGAIVVLHTDGIVSRWSLDKLPGVALRRAGLIAGCIYRDWKRGRDDATVVVLKESEA